jgi:hypothetical protein
LRPCRRPVIHGDGMLSWTDGFHRRLRPRHLEDATRT